MFKRSILHIALVLVFSAAAQAAPLVITQTIHDITTPISIDGGPASVVTGEWIFKINTDTTNPDLVGFTTQGVFDATVTLTQSSLGLVDETVTNVHYLWQSSHLDRIGFTNDISLQQPWSRASLPTPLADVNVVSAFPDQLNFQNTTNTIAFFTPLELANGMTITTVGQIANLEMSVTSQLSAAVPEPSTYLLALLGISGLVVRRKFIQK